MAVSTIALYASPPSSVCSTPHPCSINSHSSSYDFDLTTRSPSASTQSPSSNNQRQVIGGLSSLLKHSSSSLSNDEFTKVTMEDHNHYHHSQNQFSNLSSSFRYSNSSSLKREMHSPVSVFQGPVSVTSSSFNGSVVSGSFSGLGAFRVNSTTSVLLNGFVRNSLGSCLDHDVEELTFNMEDHFVFGDGVVELLASAQLRH